MISDSEQQIIRATIEYQDPSIFSNWFIRRPDSGSFLLPDDTRDFWKSRYNDVHGHWVSLGNPDYFGELDGEWTGLSTADYKDARSRLKNVYEVRAGGKFFQHHGYRFLPWQAQMYKAKQGTVVCVGGMSSGKTTAAINTVLTYAATLPNFYCVCPAPSHKQAKDIFRSKIRPALAGTYYEKKFNVQYREDELSISLTTADGSQSLIIFMTMGDKAKIKNFECDMFYVEQAEDFTDLVSGPDNIYAIIQTRLRGYINGRERVAKSLWIANASHNMEIYALRDRALDDPENYLALQTSTFDNPHIPQKHLNQMVAGVGDSEEERAYYLFGEKPLGGGEHFPKSSLVKVFDGFLDDQMKYAQRDQLPGWEVKTARSGVGIYWWEKPPIEGEKYLVVADPGWANPPQRNSASIMVFRVDGFPLEPAQLYAFWWVYGNNKPDTWIQQFIYAVTQYNAIGSCAYDATGWQGQGYERMEKGLYDVMASKIIFSAPMKQKNLNTLKMLFSRGMVQMPMIEGIFSQLMNYAIPEPPDLRQDHIAALIVAAEMLSPIYNQHVWKTQIEKRELEVVPYTRFERPVDDIPEDRWSRHAD